MSDPSAALQKALLARIIDLATLAGARVYDDVPPEADRKSETGAAWPYVSFRNARLVPIDEEHCDRSETTLDINVWSRAVGFPECQQIAGAIRIALHEKDLEIDGHVLDRMRVESINYQRDPDGLTSRARISLSVETQPEV